MMGKVENILLHILSCSSSKRLLVVRQSEGLPVLVADPAPEHIVTSAELEHSTHPTI